MPVQLNQRSKLVHTASASNGVPSWNVTSDFRLKVVDRPSSVVVQSSASRGAGSAVPGSTPIRPSKMLREMRNVSPSLAKAGSRPEGSLEEAKMKVELTSLG